LLVVPAIPIQISIIESKYCRGAGASILQEEHGGKASHDGGEGASDLHAVSSVGSDYDWDSGVGLDLTIGNLGDGWASGGGWDLNLAVWDLSHWGRSDSWDLDLSVADLRDWSGCDGWDLNLSIRDLGDWSRSDSWDLNLSIGDL